jgi:hypothetical protein
MHQKSGAKPERYEEPSRSPMQRGLGKDEDIVRAWCKRKCHGGREE